MKSISDGVDKSLSPDNLLSLVYHFPYKDLQNILETDTEQIRKCLFYLLKITSTDIFYTNAVSIKHTFVFTSRALFGYEDSFPKDVFVDLLVVLKNMVTKLCAIGKLSEVFPDLDVFAICQLLSKFEIFCAICASHCVPIMLTVLKSKSKFNYDCSLDQVIIDILENFKLIQATNEVHAVSGFILSNFPLESPTLQTCANWLLEDTRDLLKNLQIEKINIEHPVSTSIQNIKTFFDRVRGSLKASNELKKYQDLFEKFLHILFHASPQLIKICCLENVALNARHVLAVVLQEFLNEQKILSEEIDTITKEEICQFPTNIMEWPLSFNKTFFWLCHLLYFNKRFVWSTTVVAEALRKFIYTKKNKKFMDVKILKSICYIYPVLLQGTEFHERHKLFSIGNDLMMVASKCIPLFIRILSLSEWQFFWFLYKGPYVIKKITIKFWLNRMPEKKIPVFTEILVDTKSESVLLDVFVTVLKTKGKNIGRISKIIQSLHNMKLFEQIQRLIPKFRDDSEAVVALIQACCVDIPVEDKATAVKIFISICDTLDINSSTEVFVNICEYAVNVLKVLKNEETIIDSFCKNQFLLRTLISRLDFDNDMVKVAVLKFLTALLKYQKNPCYLSENIVVDLKRLLTGPSDIVGATIRFVTQLLNGKFPVCVKDENVPLLLVVLFELTNSYLSDEAYECLFQILKSYQTSSPYSYGFSDIINAPNLGMLIEDRCHFSNRKRQSATFLKFVLYWIKRMRLNPNKDICFLPEARILTSFIKRSTVLSESRALRYIQYISEIYPKDDQLATEIDSDLSLFENLSISIN